MRVVDFSFSASFAVLILVLNGVEVCNGGETSRFVRNVEKTVDMPLDSDVFALPPGYNAPQQVSFSLNFNFISSSFSVKLVATCREDLYGLYSCLFWLLTLI